MNRMAHIKWESLQHAQGPADDLPGLLARLEKDPSQLPFIEELIFSEGHLFSASPPSISILMELAWTRPEVGHLIANCCRSHLWADPRSEQGQLSQELIEIVNTQSGALLNAVENKTSDIAASCAAILFYCSDREYVAEKLLEILHQRADLSVPAKLAIALATHGALGVYVANEDSDVVGFAFRIAQSWIGMFDGEIDLLIEDLRDPEKVQQLVDLLRELDDSIGTFGELLLSGTPKVRHAITAPFIAIFNRCAQPGDAWKYGIALLHLVFHGRDKAAIKRPADLTPPQLLVLKALYHHQSIWNLERLGEDLSEILNKDIGSKDDLGAFLGKSDPVVALIMTPSESPLVRATLERFDRQEWQDTPWLLFKGDTSKLEWQIPEDRAYFTSDVMSHAYEVASAMISNIAYEIDPFIDSFRFYPNLSREDLVEICTDNGWEIHSVPTWADSLSAISYTDALAQPSNLDPGVSWKSLPKKIKTEIEICVTYLSGALWDEAEAWNDIVQKTKRPIMPLMFAKYRDLRELTISYWPYDRRRAQQNGILSGERYLLLLIESPRGESQDSNLIRIYFGENLQLALRIIRKHQDMLAETPDALQKFLQELVLKIEKVSLEFENGVVQDLSLQKFDA